MRLAVLQMEARAGDAVANLATIAEAAREAAGRGANLLVAPELATTGYGAGEAIRTLAEPLDGPQVRRLERVTAETGVALVTGFAERDGEAIWNAALLIERGELRHSYRKRHLWGDYERALFHPARQPSPVFDVAGIRVGLAICYDIEFPETARALAVAGAALALVPTALPRGPHTPFIAREMLRVRAFENQIFLAYADHCGADGAFAYAGLSCIVAPDGTDLARAGASGPALLIADIDPAAFSDCAAQNTYLADLRAAQRQG